MCLPSENNGCVIFLDLFDEVVVQLVVITFMLSPIFGIGDFFVIEKIKGTAFQEYQI